MGGGGYDLPGSAWKMYDRANTPNHFFLKGRSSKMAATKVWLPKRQHFIKFIPRDQLDKGHPTRQFKLVRLPATVLPVDCTGDARVSAPMDGNDAKGDCMEAMACHVDSIFTFMQGKAQQSNFALADIIKQYTAASGGDNGLSEDQLLNQCWKPGI